jgi:hypothetical protein
MNIPTTFIHVLFAILHISLDFISIYYKNILLNSTHNLYIFSCIQLNIIHVIEIVLVIHIMENHVNYTCRF